MRGMAALRIARLFATILVLGGLPHPAPAAKAGGIDRHVHRKPAVAPALPKAGGRFVDPTFGTTIIRVTDPQTAPMGAAVNAAPADSMFNADGTRVYLHQGNESFLYAVDRSTARITNLGQLTRTVPGVGNLTFDGAAWDPKNPNVLYAIMLSPLYRQLWQFRFPYPGTMTMLHDFSTEVSPGGYPIGRVQVSPDGRYFAIAASSQPDKGQDFLDYVVVWDRQLGVSHVLNTQARLGVLLHTMVMDTSGEYLLVETNDYSTTYVWHWPSDTVSTAIGGNLPDGFAGKKVLAWKQAINVGGTGDQWVLRSLDTPHNWTVIFQDPRKDRKINFFEGAHFSRLLPNGSFVSSRFVASFGWGTFRPHAGAVYKLVGYLQLSPHFAAPEEVRYGGRALQAGTGIPTAASQWWYDSIADTLYLWLPDSSDPQRNRSKLSIFDWRPEMEEVLQLYKDATGAWTWRRLAHHRMHWNGSFETSPRANVDPIGSFVLFQSNWDGTLRNPDGSPRTDVFLLIVPPRNPSPGALRRRDPIFGSVAGPSPGSVLRVDCARRSSCGH